MGKFAVKKVNKDGHIGLRFSAKSDGWRCDSIKVEGGSDITTAEARELAAALIEAADREDEKVAKKQAAEERRRKWREREIAADRMQVVSMRELLK